ncbi:MULTISPECIES: rod shape-determining protein MreC [Cytobacillus]|jgi:rod shape-determining protein MreC|uniref:Cell shape-determining protein MreC n=2 Tax=Cytobacillus TaxID=2675230 RepID=A0A160MET3_9BACI|nr:MULTISPECIES: rod shape-determining protein MreC [Cytobacillus]AND41662.1 rod shape-determining protein MreC [Cytobacillus oceanisediminis 2691]MBU8730406.1 rod shape-determining protein MreC [Cytobacillus oceanisediminis]MBU8770205.1 rod shape-determining protein MreC [Cytobacillus oceanisediminis]MBY0155346.1 rod shape-determining protein MreC [Cytobacillus firmus]MCM3242416.1 rod shape-determining protein MreC [Cytobacillus oceanisediminis]
MPQFFLNKRLIILLVSIIILVALIGFSLKDRENLTWPEQFLKDTTGFIQNAVSSPVNYVAGFFENVEDLQNTYKENKELKTRLDELARLESEVQRLKKDNTELREILDKKDSLSEFEPKQATVIGRNPDRWHELLIINKGKNAGIEPNMAVITSKGLIGKVKSSNTFTSTVQLLSSMDPTNRISAKIQAGDNNFFGLIEGYDKEKGLLLLKRIPYDAKVKKDQNVITSGLGGVFPESLPIGKVVDVVPDEFGLTQTAYVKPGADFYDIGHVMVVKRGALQPELMEMVDEKEEEL